VILSMNRHPNWLKSLGAGLYPRRYIHGFIPPKIAMHCISKGHFTAGSELRKVLFLALSVTSLFVYEISREPPNGFAPTLHRRRVGSLARKSLNFKVKC